MGSDRLAADDAIQVLYVLCYGYAVATVLTMPWPYRGLVCRMCM